MSERQHLALLLRVDLQRSARSYADSEEPAEIQDRLLAHLGAVDGCPVAPPAPEWWTDRVLEPWVARADAWLAARPLATIAGRELAFTLPFWRARGRSAACVLTPGSPQGQPGGVTAWEAALRAALLNSHGLPRLVRAAGVDGAQVARWLDEQLPHGAPWSADARPAPAAVSGDAHALLAEATASGATHAPLLARGHLQAALEESLAAHADAQRERLATDAERLGCLALASQATADQLEAAQRELFDLRRRLERARRVVAAQGDELRAAHSELFELTDLGERLENLDDVVRANSDLRQTLSFRLGRALLVAPRALYLRISGEAGRD